MIKRYKKALKAKVTIEALRGEKTLQDIATADEVLTNMVGGALEEITSVKGISNPLSTTLNMKCMLQSLLIIATDLSKRREK